MFTKRTNPFYFKDKSLCKAPSECLEIFPYVERFLFEQSAGRVPGNLSLGGESFFLSKASKSACHFAQHEVLPVLEVAAQDMLPGFAHQPKVEREIVDGGNLQGEILLGVEEMAQVGLAVGAVH